MKIVIISGGISGGAGIACYRLHKGLRERGIQCDLLTSNLSIPEEHIHSIEAYFKKNIISRLWYKLKYAWIFRKHHTKFFDWKNPDGLINFPVSEWPLHKHHLVKQADIINIHWFGDLINFPVFFNKLSNKKIVWALHDMSLFTAGCQYSNTCQQYSSQCVTCPFTSSQQQMHKYFQLKEQMLNNTKDNVHYVVALSSWMKQQAKSSSVLKKLPVEIIFNGIDGRQFVNENKIIARKKLKLSEHKVLGLFIAQDLNNERKGAKLLVDSLKAKQPGNFAIIAVGKGRLDTGSVECYHLGEISSVETLHLIYSAADFLIHAAISDNLPNTVIESLLCGTPVLGFKIGGMPDMINQTNGMLIPEVSSPALSEGIFKMIDKLHQFDPDVIRQQSVNTFDIAEQIKQYENLFKRISYN